MAIVSETEVLRRYPSIERDSFMTANPTRPWTHLATDLAHEFSERAARHDRDGEFVHENYETLKALRVFSALIPTELGGGGGSYRDVCNLIRVTAHGCGSTALALSMHTHLVAANVWKLRRGKPVEGMLRRVAENQLVLISTGAGDWVASKGHVEKVEGGYRVSGAKHFGSGSAVGDVLVTSAPYEDPVEGWQVLHFPVPMSTEGVTVTQNWDALGMRGTGSHSVILDGVFVPEESIALRRPRYEWPMVLDVVATIAPPIYMAAYVGVAEAAVKIALEAAQGNEDPIYLSLVGRMRNELTAAQIALESAIANVNEYDFAPSVERANHALICKTLVTNAVKATVELAQQVCGGPAFFRSHPLERMFRDVQASPFHPLPEHKQLLFSGRVATGLSPV